MVNTAALSLQKRKAHESMAQLQYGLMKIAEYILLMAFGGFVYTIIEILYRGYTHWSMFVVGGLCLIIVGLLNEGAFPPNFGIIPQCIIGGIAITLVEFCAGMVVNAWLGLAVWDYSDLPLNIMGQICLPFTLIWCVLAYVAIRADDWVRHIFFGEPYPTYVWWATSED